MAEFASKGVANAGLTTGIIGTAGWLLNGGLGNALGCGSTCSENQAVNRYELSLHQELAAKDTRIGLLEADKYTDQKLADFADRVSERFRNVEAQIAAQAVTNAQITANIACMQQNLNVLNGLTKTIVPIDNVCPKPMPQYNSWTAPTTPTTTPAA
ncbi:hypothetical protein [Candidatus Allofournierella merdipullorum]|uniref:hypothetical protein n=1 Tax=Candidatus Allofournierella merdipullorum TaxID=2838595 RepID=UPI00374E6C34